MANAVPSPEALIVAAQTSAVVPSAVHVTATVATAPSCAVSVEKAKMLPACVTVSYQIC